MNAKAYRPASGSCRPEQVRLDEGQAVRRHPGRLGPRPAPVEHGGVDVHGRDLVAGERQRNGQAAGAGRELQHGAVGAVGERQVQVEVARIVLEIEIVETGEGGRRGGIGPVEHGRDASGSRAPRAAPSGPRCRHGVGPRGR